MHFPIQVQGVSVDQVQSMLSLAEWDVECQARGRSDLRGRRARPRRFPGRTESKGRHVAGSHPPQSGSDGIEGMLMEAARIAELQQAVKAAAGSWPPV